MQPNIARQILDQFRVGAWRALRCARRQPSWRALGAAVVALLCLSPRLAAAEPILFDIPAQSAPAALAAFAARADMQILYQYDVVRDARANRLAGLFTRREALHVLLRGTGLEAVLSGDNAATIRRAEVDAAREPATRSGAMSRRSPSDGRVGSSSGPQQDPAPLRARNASGTTATQDPADLGEVEVTGSRIRRLDADSLQPRQTVDREAIDAGSPAAAAQILDSLPAFGLPGSSPVGGQSGVSVGTSFVNFLGLGSQRTLTLVDGRRFVSANTPSINGAAAPGLQVDVSLISPALIERIEVIAVGGAPVYGADAVAGTVNVIRRKDLEGLSGRLEAGSPERGGGASRRAHAAYGFAFDDRRGNLALGLDYSRTDGLAADEREVTSRALRFEGPVSPSRFQQVLVRDSRVVLVNSSGLPLLGPGPNFPNDFANAIKDARGRPMQFAADGTLVPFDPGTATRSPVFFSGGDGFDLAGATALLTDSQRTTGNLFADYRLSDTLQLGAEIWYGGSRASEVVNQPAFNESSFRTPDERPGSVLQGPIALRLDNPFLPEAARTIIAANLPDVDGDGVPDPNLDFDGDGAPEAAGFWLAKAHSDLFGNNASASEHELLRGVLTLDGLWWLAGRAYDWEVGYVHGRFATGSRNQAILSREFNLAVDAVRDATGRIRCRSTEDTGCSALNLFGNGAPSPEARAYFTETMHAETVNQQRIVSATVSGRPFSNAAGVVGIAGGLEYRTESSRFEPDMLSSSGRARGAPLTPVNGAFHTKEAYAEALVPLIGAHQGIRFATALEVEGALRLVEHSAAGGARTWTAGLRFAPFADLRLRGNYTESIRAPAITELFLPSATIFALAADPCDARFIDQGPDPLRRARNCQAAGLGQPFTSVIVNATRPMTVEGNADLRNEVAEAWTVGAVLQPSWLPNLALQVDWIEISLQDAIERLDGTRILQACFDSEEFPRAEACGRFQRDAAGQVQGLRTGFLNAGTLDFAGLTADLSWHLDLGSGRSFGLDGHYFYLDTLDVSLTGSDLDPAAGEISNSRNRATVQLTYRDRAFQGSLQWRYVGSAAFDRTDGPDTRDVPRVGAFSILSAGFRYDVGDALTLQFNIDNLGDRQPPYASLAGTLGLGGSGALTTYFPGILGRTYFLRAKLAL